MIGSQFVSLWRHIPIVFSECLAAIPLANGEGNHRGEACMSMMVYNPWKISGVPNPPMAKRRNGCPGMRRIIMCR